jgi:NADP-dependent 3-hydroxy acid dehydrogenase YdfG
MIITTMEISNQNSSIKDKVVAISGASSGIGEAIARHLAKKGAKVFLGARRMDRLQDLQSEIKSEGGQVAILLLDVTNPDSFKEFITSAIETFGGIDVLVNNAGVMPLSMVNDYKVNEWNQMIDVNIRGVLYGIASALPIFEQQNRGQFINITSVGDRWVGPTSTIYSATKFAVRAISEGLRQEVSDKIRVTIVAPGATVSELSNSISDPVLKKAADDQFRSNTIPAEAIARAVAFAIEQPEDVDVNELVVRPTAQKAF